MGLCVYPVFDRAWPGEDVETTGEILAREWDVLDEVACENGLPGLTSFADVREIPEGFDGSPEELDDILGPCTDWYAAADGAAACIALARTIQANPSIAGRFDAVEAVAAELVDLATVLDRACLSGARFRHELG